MATNTVNTDIMRDSASTYATASSSFTEESGKISATLSSITDALDKVKNDFDTHNENVSNYAQLISNATSQMESVWESGAAVTFQEHFEKFNSSMNELCTIFTDMSNSFSTLKGHLDELINGGILKNTAAYAELCEIDSSNLTTYANKTDELDEEMKNATGM